MNKAQLVDDLIKENPHSTIKDYLDLLKELEAINGTTRSNRMGLYRMCQVL
jgi:hypothetical protein